MTLPKDDRALEDFVASLYRLFFGREPDEAGFRVNMAEFSQRTPPHEIVSRFLNCPEFAAIMQQKALPSIELPRLAALYPQFYREENGSFLYVAEDDERIRLMERMIRTCGYYDRFGAWSRSIDEDKKRIAQLVECCGARSCLEIGCFNAPILSLLKDRGLDVAGIDLSHLAFVVAFPNIRRDLQWGDLLTVDLGRRFDSIVALDVLEHVSPLVLPEHLRRIKSALSETGVVIVNSPMFGHDDIFGTVFPQYISEWFAVGDRDFFRHWPCDADGWPIHGHMVLGSPTWWESRFAAVGLVRQRDLEAELQQAFVDYFAWAPARKSLFVLAHAGGHIDTAAIVAAVRARTW